MKNQYLLHNFEYIIESPNAIRHIKQFILELAVHGMLTKQDSNDESASHLLQRIQTKKADILNIKKMNKERNSSLTIEDEIPFEIPRSWKWVHIGEITKDNGRIVPEGDFTYIDVTAINNITGKIQDPKILSSVEAPSRARMIVTLGDVLFSRVRPYLLNVAIIDTEINPPPIASTAFTVLNGLGLVLPKYLWLVLRSPFMIKNVESKMRGQTYPAITSSDFTNLLVPLPPLLEQQRIVETVEKMLLLCENIERVQANRENIRNQLLKTLLSNLVSSTDIPNSLGQITQLEQLISLISQPAHVSRLRETILDLAVSGKLIPQDSNDGLVSNLVKQIELSKSKYLNSKKFKRKKTPHSEIENLSYEVPESWIWLRMDDCFQVSGGIRKSPDRVPSNNAYPYLGVSNVYRGRLNLSEIKYFELFEGDLEKFELQENDILVVEGNGSENEIGRCAIWMNEIEHCVHQNHIIRCRPYMPALAPYIVAYLNSPPGIQKMKSLAVTSSGLYNLSVGKISTIMIPVPPLAEQQRILRKIEDLFVLCDRLESGLSVTETKSSDLLDAVLNQFLGNFIYRKLVSMPIRDDIDTQTLYNSDIHEEEMLSSNNLKFNSSNPVTTIKQMAECIEGLGGSALPEHLLRVTGLSNDIEKFFDLLREGRDLGILVIPIGIDNSKITLRSDYEN